MGDKVTISYKISGEDKMVTRIRIYQSDESGGGWPKGTCLCKDGTYSKACCSA